MTISAKDEARALLERLETDEFGAGKCSDCGKLCAGALDCDCERASWEPLTINEVAALGLRAASEREREAIERAAGDYAELEIWQDEMIVAGCSGPRARAFAEALHYAAVYQQDGEVRIEEVTRRYVDPEEARAAIRRLSQEGGE